MTTHACTSCGAAYEPERRQCSYCRRPYPRAYTEPEAAPPVDSEAARYMATQRYGFGWTDLRKLR